MDKTKQKSSAYPQYHHNRYAGSKGDLWKHYLLQQVLSGLHLTPEDRVLDSHGGPGAYRLQPGNEWKRGLGEIGDSNELEFYLQDPWFSKTWRRFKSKTYYGSWLLLSSWLPCQITACDHNPRVIASMRSNVTLSPNPDKLSFVETESFSYLSEYARDFNFLFIDPAYSLKDGNGDDWEKLQVFIANFIDKDFMIWYPLYGPRKPNRIVSEFGVSGVELHWPTKRSSAYVPKGCGVFLSEHLTKGSCHLHHQWRRFAKFLGGNMMIRNSQNTSPIHLFGDTNIFDR